MRDVIPVELADGTAIWAVVGMSGPSDVAFDPAPRALKGLAEAVRGVATNVRDGLADIAPDEVSIEFGVELVLAGDSLVAALAGLSGNTSIKIQLSWTSSGSATESR